MAGHPKICNKCTVYIAHLQLTNRFKLNVLTQADNFYRIKGA